MSGKYRGTTDIVLNNVDVNASASSSYSDWISCSSGEGFSVWLQFASVGAASVILTMDISPLPKTGRQPTDTNLEPDDFTQSIAFTATTTKTMQSLTIPAQIDRPFRCYRIKVAVTVANATDIYVFVNRGGN